MVRLFALITALALVTALPATAGKGRWSYVGDQGDPGWHGAGIDLGGHFASIHYAAAEGLWIATVATRQPGDITRVISRVTRKGQEDAQRWLEGEELQVTRREVDGLTLMSFVIPAEDVVLFQKGRTWWIVTDQEEVPIPLIGSFLALKRVQERVEAGRLEETPGQS